MKLFRLKHQVNWKYIIGEILLIFVGINLAIWFNNWNNSKEINQNKQLAITKIKEEIQNNIEELKIAQVNCQQILNASEEFQKNYAGNSSKIIASPKDFFALQNKYPDFFRVEDSLELEDGIFQYSGGTYIVLELPNLNQIAWETTKSINISNELKYECLYDLESTYNLQNRVEKEIDKAANALQLGKMKELMSILNFLEQLDEQLLKAYNKILEEIDTCG